MTYTKLQSSLERIDRSVTRYFIKEDTESIIELAWQIGYEGEPYFSSYSQDMIDKLGISSLCRQSYQEGFDDKPHGTIFGYWKKLHFLFDF